MIELQISSLKSCLDAREPGNTSLMPSRDIVSVLKQGEMVFKFG